MANKDMFSTLIDSLKEHSHCDVVVDAPPGIHRNVISVSRLKMNTLISWYGLLSQLSHKYWSNLPDPPSGEKTYIFLWTIACDEYCVNNTTMSWEGSTINTFIHLWSVVDRMRYSFEREGLGWLISTRNCADYCKSMSIPGPLDAHLYRPELVFPVDLDEIDNDIFPMVFTNHCESFESFYDFTMSVSVSRGPVPISVSEIEANNRLVISPSRRP